MTVSIITTIIISILIGIGIFLILRWFWLWYWKIDKIVDLLSIMREEIIEINEKIKGD